MLPILKAALSSVKTFAVTTMGKIVIVAVLGTAAIGGTGAAVYNAKVQPAQSQARAAAMTTEVSNMADISSTSNVDSTALAVSSDTSSTASTSNTPESLQTTGNSEIDSAVSAGIQQINSATSKAVSKIQGTSSKPQPGPSIEMPIINYPVINPSNGNLVGCNEPNYAKFKAELGGDAGTVMPDDSKAIATARAKLKAASEAAASSSATSN